MNVRSCGPGGGALRGMIGRLTILRAAQATLLGLAIVEHRHAPPAHARSCAVILLVLLSLAAGGLSALVEQVVVHACAHPGSFSGSRRTDDRLREAFCVVNLQGHRDYLVLHAFHHRFTNSERDPTFVRDGQSWTHYVATLFYRQLVFMRRPEYRRFYDRLFHKARRCRSGERLLPRAWDRLRQFSADHSTLIADLLLLLVSAVSSWSIGRAAGLLALLAWWITPALLGHILMADFSYRSHLGLPPREACHPYSGQDTWSLRDGPWYAMLNWLTWGFYDHRPHHACPSMTVRVQPSSEIAQ